MLFIAALAVKVIWIDSPWGWVLVGVAAVAEIGETFGWVVWNRRRRARVGVETLVGETAVVLTPCRPEGQVRIQGEIWQACCPEGVDPGEPVIVERVDGLTLTVRRS